MQDLMKQAGGGGAPGAESGPAGGPAAAPMQPKGAEAMADVKMGAALKMIRDAYGVYTFGSDKSKAIGEMLNKAMKLFPEQATQPLQGAQMAQLMTKPTAAPQQPAAAPAAGAPQ